MSKFKNLTDDEARLPCSIQLCVVQVLTLITALEISEAAARINEMEMPDLSRQQFNRLLVQLQAAAALALANQP
jgi:hypothetical protein